MTHCSTRHIHIRAKGIAVDKNPLPRAMSAVKDVQLSFKDSKPFSLICQQFGNPSPLCLGCCKSVSGILNHPQVPD